MDTTTVIDSLHNAAIIDTSFSLKALLTQTITSSTSNQFLQGGLILGALAWLAVQLKGIPIKMWNRIDRLIRYTVYFDDTNDFYMAFTKWYGEKYPHKFRNVNVKLKSMGVTDNGYGGYYVSDEKEKKKFRIVLSQYTDFNTFRYQKKLLFISKNRTQFQSAQNLNNAYLDSYSVYGFFARKALARLMEEIRTYRESMYEASGKIEIYFNGLGTDWDIKEFSTYKTFNEIFSKSKSFLLKDLELFNQNKSIYKRINLAFKRGYLLYGPPGNGKTSMTIAMAEHLKMDLYIVNLSSIPDDVVFIKLMNDVPPNSIILFEDIDSYVLARFGERDKTQVSFSALLNALNGVYEPNDAIIVMTTNNIDALDPALIRAGRIDKKIHIQNPNWQEVIQFIQFFFNSDYRPVIFDLDTHLNICMADVQGVCISHINSTIEATVQALHVLIAEKNMEVINANNKL